MATITTPETDRLLAEVRAHGIHYLTGTVDARTAAAARHHPWPDTKLLAQLALCPDVRIRECMIALCFLSPDLIAYVEPAREQLDDSQALVANRLVTLALAAVYLQRKWFPRLTVALNSPPQIPEAAVALYSQQRRLPPPWYHWGEDGLQALQAWERQYANPLPGFPINFIGGWQDQLEHLMIQVWRERPARASLPPDALTLPASPNEDMSQSLSTDKSGEEHTFMSLRRDVSRDDIERFLQELGRMVRTSGRIYLAGGAALVHIRLRGAGASTEDIDIKLDVADENEVETAIRQLKTRLGMNIELASPADFIPLPASWQSMSSYVGRYGSLDVFYFDFYTLALSKIERAQSKDLRDVEALAQQGLIQRDQLEATFQEILPLLGSGRFFNIDPARFAQQFTAIVQHIWGQQP